MSITHLSIFRLFTAFFVSDIKRRSLNHSDKAGCSLGEQILKINALVLQCAYRHFCLIYQIPKIIFVTVSLEKNTDFEVI